jgi:DNA-3-methyladenine glycosylase
LLANPYRGCLQPGSPRLAEHATLGQHSRTLSADSRPKMVQKSKPSAPISPALGKPLKRSFFDRSVHEVAPDLIGATFLVNGVGGIIVEVEAYHHSEPAAHSFHGPTPRNRIMFGPAGFSYVYRSYGIHWCMNFVCEEEGSASAVLIRALEPTHGLAAMRRRRGLPDQRALCSGPGKLCEALGITLEHSELPLDRPPIALHARTSNAEIVSGVRIGITKAAGLPWRYGLKGSKFLSKPFPT